MKRSIGAFFGFLSLSLALSVSGDTKSFDADWRFARGDVTDAQQIAFDDAKWQAVDVPHDWSIEGPFSADAPTRGSGGFLPAGVGWYRKHFKLPADAEKNRVYIDFDGVMANSEVWINGQSVGKRPYGYSSFRYDLTGKVNFGAGKENVLAVRADNSQQPASRWYSGAGIYRHVRLVVADPVHFELWGNFITTPKVTADVATVHIRSVVVNTSDVPREVMLLTSIKAPEEQAGLTPTYANPQQTIPPGGSAIFEGDVTVHHPQLWDLDHPDLYSAVITAKFGMNEFDTETIPFGIRTAEFKADSGFWLNGNNIKLKGACVHHDGGAFGAAVPNAVWERRFKALKEIGVNAIRTAHNPMSPDFYDVCDRMGLVVMDETFDCWTKGKNPYDYSIYFKEWFKIDARDMVLRDRNHPSIILYSAGNEIHDTPKPEIAKPILRQIVDVYHAADPSRPVTQALFRPNVSHDYDNGLSDMLDVVGTNYRDAEVIAAHKAKPTRKIVGTEQGHDRRVWLFLRDTPEYAGQFLWTGVDYLGESRRWPTIGAGSGLIDRIGSLRPRAYERQSWWSDKPMAKIARRVAPPARTPDDPGFEPLGRVQVQFTDWTPKNLDSHAENVEVYSNCDEVELFLNGKSLGAQSKPKDDSPRSWKVDFEPGTIKAVAKNGDKVVATDELKTAGKPAKVVLASDRSALAPTWDDVAFVCATVTDADGTPIPGAKDLVTFKVTGPGVVAAVDNGDNASHESFQGNQRSAFQGTCYAMIKAKPGSGKITLEATADGLAAGTLTIDASGK